MSEEQSQEYWQAIEKAYDEVSIYDGPKVFREQYEKLEPAIGKLLAVHWCVSEVCNGGFDQFFSNPTGVLAPEAAEAFAAFGMERCASIVRRAMSRLGPEYPRDRRVRNVRLYLARPAHSKSSATLFDPEDAEFYDCYDKEADGCEAAGLRYLHSQRS